MTVILVLLMFAVALLIDYFKKTAPAKTYAVRGTMITTQGFEMLGALAQDGGELMNPVQLELFKKPL